MKSWLVGVAVATVLLIARPALAHPAPFSFLDMRIGSTALDLTLVVHVFDIGHDVGAEPPEQLLDANVLASKAAAIDAVVTPRVHLLLDGAPTPIRWSAIEAAADRQAVRLQIGRAHV